VRIPDQIFYGRLLLALAGGLLCAAMSYFHWVQPLDRMLYDIFNEANPMPLAEDIVIVAMDERSLQKLGRWPWPREMHVELLRQLHAVGARAVALDILFAEADAGYPEVDTLLAAAIKAHGATVLPVFIGRASRGSELREIPPLTPLAASAAALGHVHIEVESDGVARSVFLKEGVGEPRWPHFTVALHQLLGADISVLPGVSDQEVLRDPDPSAIIRSHANLVPFMGPAGTVAQASYYDVMQGSVKPELLRDKIVFVGATAAGHVDNITTSLGQISGVEVNATIFQALRNGLLAQPLPGTVCGFIVFAITAMTILFFTRLAPRQLLLAVLASAVLLPLASFLTLYLWRLWISPAPVVLTLLVAYPLWNWLRLDAAVDFIHAQLQNLEKENRELSHGGSWSEVEHAANFLQSLGHISGWQWHADVPAGAGDAGNPLWQSSGSSSSRVFTFGNDSRSLSLTWQPGHETVAETLHRVFPDDGIRAARPGSGADFINVNLTQLDLAYREARRNRDLVKGTLEQLGSGVILSELSGEVLLINQQARDFLGIAGECNDLLRAMSTLELEGDEDILEAVNHLVLQAAHFNHEGNSLATGQHLFCQGGVVRLERPMLVIVLTDVSELKQSEKRRIEALNFLSHDLRAPLTSVLALIEHARNESATATDPELLEAIEKYIQRNLSYAENFTQMAKIAHEKPARLDECDAHSLVDNAVAQLFHAAGKQGVRLRIAYGDDDVWVNCNRALVERALLNLIDNAIKHSREGDTVTVTLRCNSVDAIFDVSDEGEGIAPADMERIFDHFEQGANARSGVGLGLRFVSAVASSHDGAINVCNNSTGGACFTLRIPLQQADL